MGLWTSFSRKIILLFVFVFANTILLSLTSFFGGTLIGETASTILPTKPSATLFATPSVSPRPTQPSHRQQVAFPGAEGFGKYTKGGRGGRVIPVTNLNDSGKGSFREAVTASGPRIVVFQVSGTIDLKDDISIREPYLTVAGQTAPGEGVQIKGGMIRILTHEVIIRYLKVRMGNPTGGNPSDTDPISLSAQRGREIYNVIIDHCSLVWGTDIGGISILTNVHDVTIQDSIIGEGLYRSKNKEAPHSKALNITQLEKSSQPTRISIYRNLITTSDERNPQVQGAVNTDIVNNVIYNWGNKSSFGNPRSLNLIKNYYIRGPESREVPAWSLRTNPENPEAYPGSVYEQGTELEGIEVVRGGPRNIYTSSRFSPYSIEDEMSPQAAYDYIVKNAGATKPARDSDDQRIIQNLVTRKGTFLDDKELVWPKLASGTSPADSDRDGIPDTWESKYFRDTSKRASISSSSDSDGDGYTDFEEYLNGTNPLARD